MTEQKYEVMAGFFHSINHDRVYSAEDINKPYNRVISDGIFATREGTPSNDLQVLANNGMEIVVKKGNGMVANKWFENPNDLIITTSPNNNISTRIDSIIIQVDNTIEKRVGNIVYREGTATDNPKPPLINTVKDVIEYRIANIEVPSNIQKITQNLITDLRGSSECPWITGLIKQVDTSTLFEQYKTAYQNYYNSSTQEFEEFINNNIAQWQSFIAGLSEDLSINTNLVKYESSFVTSSNNMANIPINITPYNKEKDILLVKINNLFATETVDYTISSNSQNIVLTKALKENQRVEFVVLQTVIVGNAETILQQLQKLQNKVDVDMKQNYYKIELESEVADNSEITIPCKYEVR